MLIIAIDKIYDRSGSLAIAGKAVFRVADGEPFEAGAGDMVLWQRGFFHEVIDIIQHPLVFLAIDAPTRREGDVQR